MIFSLDHLPSLLGPFLTIPTIDDQFSLASPRVYLTARQKGRTAADL